ncbi:hypothetical protein B0T25DRAFT_57382 [Lasiosphaeria hispida]|uniref:HNH nuclease domain-containing protein n=1 Tax=Lasiosphaeria hispida TaxID=260671 RepID=A0AAJ0HWM5_9PEZI|nr:hypothetical protein B0T25DRAFT_57382 [Lasiosphaeria hispida]
MLPFLFLRTRGTTGHGCSSAHSFSVPLFPSCFFSTQNKPRTKQSPTNTNPNLTASNPNIKSQHQIPTGNSSNPIMAAPGNPLLDGLDFSLAQPLSANPHLRTQAINRFSHVIEHFEALERKPYIRNYNRPALIRLTFEYARSAESQDRLLLAFFHRLRLGMRDSDGDIVFDSGLRSLLYAFAEDLMNSFFIPLRAAGSQHTPQLTPLSHAAIQNAQTQEDQDQIKASKGPTRLSTLRSVCLIRDRYRCAITHMFDKGEAVQRFEEAGRMGLQDPQDDEGNILDPDDAYTYLEVAHILPHSLTEETNGQLVWYPLLFHNVVTNMT